MLTTVLTTLNRYANMIMIINQQTLLLVDSLS